MQWKLLFLDIDGPLRPFPQATIPPGFRLSTGQTLEEGFNITCLNHLKWLLTYDPTIRIIISSDVRHSYTLNEMKEIFMSYDINPELIVGYTPALIMRSDKLESSRVSEIVEVISLYRPEKYVVLDDLDLSQDIINFVHVKSNIGLNREIIQKALNFLK